MNRLKPLPIILMAIIYLFCQSELTSKDFNLQKFKEKLPKLLTSSNAGTDFWITFNPCWETTGSRNDLKIYVSSEYATRVTVEIPGKGYLRQQTTAKNDVIEFTLTPDLGQCYRKTDRQAPSPDQVFPGYGVHIYSQQPIIVYGVTRYQYTSDSYLAIPVTSLGNDYVVASWCDISDFGIQYLPSYTAIVSSYDNNKVNFKMGGTENSKTAGGQLPGETRNYTLNKGDVLLISSYGQRADLSGSRIQSTKPVGVISSNFCAYVPENTPACDFMMEMELPTYSWGKKYLYTPIYGRLMNSIIKIFTKEDRTNILMDGVSITTLDSASGLENDGWLKLRADVGAPRPIVFSGNKPIYVEQYNCGQQDDNVLSDPFMMLLIPAEQLQKEIMLNTPGINGGFGFAVNYINVVYSSVDGSLPDDLEFATVQSGQFVWKKLGAIDPKQGLPFNIPINGKNYFNKTIKLPSDDVYKIRANNPIGVYSYGFSTFDSYGHPASVSLFDISKNDSFPPKPTWTMSCEGLISKGKVEDLPNDTSLRSNLYMIIFNTDSSFNFDFTYDEFIPREASNIKWYGNVIDKSKDAKAVISFIDGSGNDTTIVINYFVKKISTSADTINFGSLLIGEDTIINTFIYNDTNGDIIIDSAFFKFKNQGFELIGLPTPDTLYPGDTLRFGIKFTATADGSFTDSLGFASQCLIGKTYRICVKANAGNPRIEVSDIDFGDVKVQNLNYKNIEVRNSGNSDLIITQVKGTTDKNTFIADFSNISDNNPIIIHPYEYKTFEVTFYPTETKKYLDTIYFISNTDRTTSPDSISILIGNGKGDLGPVIDVSDANWGYVERYTNTTKNVELKNTGDKDLYVTDYQPPKYYLFEEKIEPKFNINNPLILRPNEVYNFDVDFKAEEVTLVGFVDKIIFNSNANSGDSIANLSVDSVVITGIEDFDLSSELEIVPNPTDDFIILKNIRTNGYEYTVKIYDIWGLQIFGENYSSSTNNLQIKTDVFSSGFYFLQIINNGESVRRKFCVMR
ncbi:MAG: choice-of-anchor D domain-containing protein [Ignavibacteriae bacterium]|nr:choice-of-anchor D domain-containing protein [Ignavibacteriota bacterium]